MIEYKVQVKVVMFIDLPTKASSAKAALRKVEKRIENNDNTILDAITDQTLCFVYPERVFGPLGMEISHV
jgi:hypothetical protein